MPLNLSRSLHLQGCYSDIFWTGEVLCSESPDHTETGKESWNTRHEKEEWWRMRSERQTEAKWYKTFGPKWRVENFLSVAVTVWVIVSSSMAWSDSGFIDHSSDWERNGWGGWWGEEQGDDRGRSCCPHHLGMSPCSRVITVEKGRGQQSKAVCWRRNWYTG